MDSNEILPKGITNVLLSTVKTIDNLEYQECPIIFWGSYVPLTIKMFSQVGTGTNILTRHGIALILPQLYFHVVVDSTTLVAPFYYKLSLCDMMKSGFKFCVICHNQGRVIKNVGICKNISRIYVIYNTF